MQRQLRIAAAGDKHTSCAGPFQQAVQQLQKGQPEGRLPVRV